MSTSVIPTSSNSWWNAKPISTHRWTIKHLEHTWHVWKRFCRGGRVSGGSPVGLWWVSGTLLPSFDPVSNPLFVFTEKKVKKTKPFGVLKGGSKGGGGFKPKTSPFGQTLFEPLRRGRLAKIRPPLVAWNSPPSCANRSHFFSSRGLRGNINKVDIRMHFFQSNCPFANASAAIGTSPPRDEHGCLAFFWLLLPLLWPLAVGHSLAFAFALARFPTAPTSCHSSSQWLLVFFPRHCWPKKSPSLLSCRT